MITGVIVTSTEDGEPLGREMGPWGVLWSRIRRRVTRISRRFPRLVWYGDELDVRVTFKGIGGLGEDKKEVFNAGQLFSGMGIRFDTGSGCHGRDWEWDWSLRGPISVTFRGRAKHPERRIAEKQPDLKLVS